MITNSLNLIALMSQHPRSRKIKRSQTKQSMMHTRKPKQLRRLRKLPTRRLLQQMVKWLRRSIKRQTISTRQHKTKKLKKKRKKTTQMALLGKATHPNQRNRP